TALKDVKPDDRKLLTMHESMFYFTQSFECKVVGSIQPRAGVELDATQLKELVDRCQTQKVRVIAVEPQYPEGAAKTLRDEVKKQGTDLKTIVLDPLETAAPADLKPDWYEEKMRQNIHNLAEALR